MMNYNPIICALDTNDFNQALELTKLLKDKVGMVKLGLEFFVAHGLIGVQKISDVGIPVFLDLKLHDIPNTVFKTIEVIKSLNISMITIHISGGERMIRESVSTLYGSNIMLIGVTVLTSMNDLDLLNIGISNSVEQQVMILSKLAKSNNLNGIVCSACEALKVRQKYDKGFKVIVPGIRLDSFKNGDISVKEKNYMNDQKRTKTPKEAMENGADYLVIGRPITESRDPIAVVEKLCEMLV